MIPCCVVPPFKLLVAAAIAFAGSDVVVFAIVTGGQSDSMDVEDDC